MIHPTATEYEGTALVADPIHRYIQFTVPVTKGEVTEKQVIDSRSEERRVGKECRL